MDIEKIKEEVLNKYGLKCLHCDYKWLPRKNNPKNCPKCKSYNYDKEPQTKYRKNL